MSFPSQGYIPTTVPIPKLVDSVVNQVLIADAEWFASDIVPTPPDDFGSELILVFCFDSRTEVEVTYDGGTNWHKLNNGLKMEAETLNSFNLPVMNIDQVNFRADTAGTLRFARVLELGLA